MHPMLPRDNIVNKATRAAAARRGHTGTPGYRKAGADACRYQLIPEQKEDERRYTCLENGGTKIIKIHKKQKVSDE